MSSYLSYQTYEIQFNQTSEIENCEVHTFSYLLNEFTGILFLKRCKNMRYFQNICSAEAEQNTKDLMRKIQF